MAKDRPQANIQDYAEGRRLIPVLKLKMFFMGVSLAVIAASLYVIAVHGINFGVDFKGGVKMIYKFAQPTSDGKVREIIEPLGVGDPQVVRFGKKNENSFLIKVKYQKDREIAREITGKLSEVYGAKNLTLLSEETVGPKVGKELRKRGMFAVGLTWILILIYVGWRFDFLFAPGAVLALFHDIIITLGFFTFFDKEFNLPILAAILTIIGYSINDTIIVYDRIRENLKKLPASVPINDLITLSLNETFSRTIVTSLTALFAMGVLFFLGGGVLHDFAFCLIIGIIVGTYSSIFIATPVYLVLNRLFPHKGLIRGVGKR